MIKRFSGILDWFSNTKNDEPIEADSLTEIARNDSTALVLSGGGVRAAYQIGALKAIQPYIEKDGCSINIIVGSSIGAVNGLVVGACLKDGGLDLAISELDRIWKERNHRNTFAGHPSVAFFRSVRMAITQWMSPGPKPSTKSLFDPTPLRETIDSVIAKHGGLEIENRHPDLHSLAVMTTVEAQERSPMLLVSSSKSVQPEDMAGSTFALTEVPTLSAKHGFASAALPSVLPPVELSTNSGKIKFVDGGISQNVPVDPAVRLGGERVIVIDISGRDWWHDQAGEPHDARPYWEVPAKKFTHCLRPSELTVIRCKKPLGPLVKQTLGNSTKKFISALGPVWPLFTLLKNKVGEDIAYEVMSYIALEREYMTAVIERGYNETLESLKIKKDNLE